MIKSINTLILNFQPLELSEMHFYCLMHDATTHSLPVLSHFAVGYHRFKDQKSLAEPTCQMEMTHRRVQSV